jgi:uncharacterized protein YkwD
MFESLPHELLLQKETLMQAITDKINDSAGAPHPNFVYTRDRASRNVYRGGIALTMSILAALLAQPFQASATAPLAPPASELYLAPTGQTIQGAFLQTFQKYGLEAIGYPLTSELNEGGRTVQYFERVKMEYYPELAAQGTPVLFTRLGADISAGSSFPTVKSFAPIAFKTYFAQTGHSLAEPFLSFWRNNGDVNLFGYPISEVIWQDGMQVQWFERARMEYHPELAAKGYAVQLTLLGTMAYSRAYKGSVQLNSPLLINMNSIEASLLTGINTQRAAVGVAPVSINPSLADFAHWRSSDMASRNYFSHTTPEGKTALQLLRDRGISYSWAGEIIEKNSFGQADAANEAITNFLQSSAHRSIMLDSRYIQVGIGFAPGSDGMSYFTAVFISN